MLKAARGVEGDDADQGVAPGVAGDQAAGLRRPFDDGDVIGEPREAGGLNAGAVCCSDQNRGTGVNGRASRGLSRVSAACLPISTALIQCSTRRDVSSNSRLGQLATSPAATIPGTGAHRLLFTYNPDFNTAWQLWDGRPGDVAAMWLTISVVAAVAGVGLYLLWRRKSRVGSVADWIR